MRSSRIAPIAAAVLLAAGCGSEDPAPLPRACTAEPAAIVRALETAPQTVTLENGVRLSACLRDARTDADLQNVGVALSQAAERLELAALSGDEEAALRLGYLVGAARRGAETSIAVTAELVRRLERSAALDGGAGSGVADALERGLAAGESRG